MKKKIVLIITIILLCSTNAGAVNGHVSLEYDMLNGVGTSEIYLYKDWSELRVAGRLQTGLYGFNLKGNVIPAGQPLWQTYDLEITYNINKQYSLTLISGCKHYLSQSGVPAYEDESYIKIIGKYEF